MAGQPQDGDGQVVHSLNLDIGYESNWRRASGYQSAGMGGAPVRRPGVPVWAAGFPGTVKPLHRAARGQGFFPVNLDHPDQLAEAVATIAGLRARL
jgi:hypothetical protein